MCTTSRAQRSRRSQSSGAVALNSSTSRPRTAAASGLNASAGASMRKKWMPASIACEHGRRDLVGRFDGDALEREVGLEHARERLSPRRCRPARPRQRMLAGLEDDALVGLASARGADRLRSSTKPMVTCCSGWPVDGVVCASAAVRRQARSGRRTRARAACRAPPRPARGAQERNHAGATHR